MERYKEYLFIVSISILLLASILLFNTGNEYEIFGLVKPITIIQYSGILSFMFFLWVTKPFFMKMGRTKLQLLIILGFLFAMATFFEMLWSFNYWFSIYSTKVIKDFPENSETLDELTYTPKLNYFYQQVPLNQSAKRNTLFFFMSIYFIYFLKNIETEKRRHMASF